MVKRKSKVKAAFRNNRKGITKWNRKVLALGRKGINATVIAETVPLTIGQVRGILEANNVSIRAYRRGQSPEVQRLINRVENALGTIVEIKKEIAKLYPR